jgi:sugar O-acyltransferase (sialic acid O-acetyltransferase NeuD family)
MTAKQFKVVLFGNGQVASVAHSYLTHDSPYEVVAFTVDRSHLSSPTLLGLPVVPFEEVEQHYPPDVFHMHISMSFRRINKLRAEKFRQAEAKGYRLVTYISSRALVAPEVTLGRNCWIMENTVIQPYVIIGDDVHVDAGTQVGHHSAIGDHCFLAAQVAVAGFVTIEPYCFLGMNAIVRDGISIGAECVIGAGALMLKSARPQSVYVGRQATLLPTSSDHLPEDLR